MRTVNIVLLGHGTVGSAVRQILQDKREWLSEQLYLRTGQEIALSLQGVLVKNPEKHSLGDLLYSDPNTLFQKENEIVIELIGGTEPVSCFIERALLQGKDVVTANKKALFTSQGRLEKLALEQHCLLGYEAAVAGAIPILRSLSSLGSGRVRRIRGIINGSTNYVLTKLNQGDCLVDALEEAKQLGYLEADPSCDVDGYDAMYKLGILTYLATGFYPTEGEIERVGIRTIPEELLDTASKTGQRIKLIAEADFESRRFSVKPELVLPEEFLYQVNGATNGISLWHEHAGEQSFQGLGAGGFETASAVIGNLLDIVSERTRRETW